MEVNNDVDLIGEYFGDSYAERAPHDKAIGWKGLKIGQIIPGRPAPYKIVREGISIGWAPPSSIKKKTQIIQNGLDEGFISVNFVSMGSQVINNFSVVCKQSWPFSEIEKQLYEEYPEFNNPQTFFMVNAKMVEKHKTLKENNIRKNSVISVMNDYI